MKHKPYYDPQTRETYMKIRLPDGRTIRAITGSVELVADPSSSVHSFRINRNDFGQITNKERVNSHFVCYGCDNCVVCGRVLREKLLPYLKNLLNG